MMSDEASFTYHRLSPLRNRGPATSLYLDPLHLSGNTASRSDALKSPASIVDAIGRRACSGVKLRLPFGAIGILLIKGRTIRFEFAEGFRRPRMDPRRVEASGVECVRKSPGSREDEK